jgi:hypothetical protein
MRKLLTIFLITIVHSVYGMPPTDYFTTVADGDWSTNGTWDTGTPPPTNQTGGNDDITIDHNVTLTGALDVKSGTVITINAGDTLTINGDVEFNNGCTFIVNGVLIINGDVANNNNSDGVVINGEVIIDGDYDGGNGSDLSGTGGMDITGSVTTDGDATVFGSDTDCTVDCDNSADSPLPIELVFFRAELNESNHVVLEWLTGSEINNDYFEIVRSSDGGTTWVGIGTVKGVGNSSTPQFYSFVDTSNNKGYNYYKLIQYDFNGEYEEHKMVVMLIEHNYVKELTIYPNPARFGDDVSVKLEGFKGQEILIIVMDALGKIYYEKAILSSKDNVIIVIDSNLSSGTYLIVGSEKHELYRRKLVVR